MKERPKPLAPPDGSNIVNVVQLYYAEGPPKIAEAATAIAAPAPAAGGPALAVGLLAMLLIAVRRMRPVGDRASKVTNG